MDISGKCDIINVEYDLKSIFYAFGKWTMKKKFLALFAIVCVFCCAIGLAACDTNDGGEVAVTEITLDKTELTLTEGESYTFTATITPENANDQSMEWSSSDENVATVDYASVFAKAEGEATITVTASNGKTATCTVTVVAEEEEPPAKYTVTFNARGGKFEGGTDTYETQVEDGAKLPDVTVTRGDDYVFTGWYLDEYCTRAWDLEEYTVNEKTTVYAGWKYKNKFQPYIDALADRIRTERRDDSLKVEILSTYTDNIFMEGGHLCFIEKDSTGVFAYSTDISDSDEKVDNDGIISEIKNTTLTKIKDYNDKYTSDSNAYVADNMALKFAEAKEVIYSCVSEWEEDTEHITNGGTYYSCKVKAIIADEKGRVFDYSVTVVAGVAQFDLVLGGSASSKEYDETFTPLGEIANGFYSERVKEKQA